MYSSNNNGNGSFSPYFPLSTSFFGHETLFIPQNPNFLQHDFPNFVDPISNGFVKHFSPSYESDISKEMPKKKKDMNRKINTARGPRERRIRLSLNVAQKFFDLQDMLGFDKASETLDWLLGQSNSAIKELKRVSDRYVNSINNHKKSANCNSNCEVLLDQANEASKQIDMKGNFTRDKRTSKPLSQVVGRDSRSKARERARKRTKEKMGATRACDIMHLGTSCPIMNENEVPNYSDTMMVNFLNEHDACLKVSKEQRTCTIGDSYSINVSLIKPFPNSNNMNSSNDYENWENIGALAHRSQPFSYLKSSALDTGLQNL